MNDQRPHDQPVGSSAGHDPVEQVLAAAAATPVVIAADRFAAIEARVMAAVEADDHGVAPFAVGPVATEAAIRRRTRAMSFLSVAAVVIVVALGALAVILVVGQDDALAIAAADRVVVELPDGDSIVGEAGVELPDGTRLDVIGFVEIDGTRFGPGSYTIVDGAVVADDSSDTSVDLDETGATGSSGSVDGGDGPTRTTVIARPGATDDVATDDVATDDVGADAGASDPATDTGGDARPGGAVDGEIAPRPTDPLRMTVPQRTTPDVTRPPDSTRAPTRPATTAPVRPTTTAPPSRPTSTTTATSTTTTSTTAVPARTTVPDADGRSRDGRP